MGDRKFWLFTVVSSIKNKENMKRYAVISIILSVLTIHASESDKYQTNYDAYYGQYADNSVSGEAYDQSDSASEFQQHLLKYVQQYQEKQDGLSILDDPSALAAVGVFAAVGIGGLAYFDLSTRYTNLCNKLKEVTKIARTTSSDGTSTVTLATTGTATTGLTTANTVINSNRVFINSLASISDLAC